MRRLLLVALAGVLLLATAMVAYMFLAPRPAHISNLVPNDFEFGVFCSSLNDLDELYEAPHRNRENNPPMLRFGRPVNVPSLDGFSYDDPAGSFLTENDGEVFLVPVRDVGAFEDAFEREREQISIRPPKRPAKNYLALGVKTPSVHRGDSNQLVLRATEYPLAVAGHPRDGVRLRSMLAYLLVRETPRKPPGVPILGREVGRIPADVADVVAAQCEDLLLGVKATPLEVRVEGEALLSDDGMVARSAHLAAEVGLANMVASFPHNTALLLGGVLDGKGWAEAGLPLPVGNAAVAFALIWEPHHARQYVFLMAARPQTTADLEKLRSGGAPLLLDDPKAELSWNEVNDGEAVVRTASVAAPPAWLALPLRSSADAPPPMFVTTAVERGIWYCAIGSQAEGTVRRALGCLRDRPELGLRRQKAVGAHPGFLTGTHVGLALVTANGLRAFKYSTPMFEFASLGQPEAVTAILDVDGLAKLDVRIGR